MIEIVAVLILISIVAVFVVGRLVGVTDAAVRVGVPRKVMAHLRYVQSRAMGDHACRYYIAFTGTTYSLKKIDLESENGATATLILPGESSTVVTLEGDVTISEIIGIDAHGSWLRGSDPAGIGAFAFKDRKLFVGGITLILGKNGYIGYEFS